MAKESTFKKMLQLRDTSIWEYFSATEAFALDLPSGERGYISFFQETGNHGIGIYRGNAGLSSYMSTFIRTASDLCFNYFIIQQKYLEVCFLDIRDPSFASEEIIVDIEAFERLAGRQMEDGEFLPRIVRMEPFRTPVSIASSADEEDVVAVLDLALYLAKHLSPYGYTSKAKQALGIYPRSLFTSHSIPLFKKSGEKYAVSMIQVPIPKQFFYAPALPEDDLMDYLRQQKGDAIHDMTVALRINEEPVESLDQLSRGIFPPILMATGTNDPSLIAPLVAPSIGNAGLDGLLAEFCENLSFHGKPETIFYGERPAYEFLQEFCASTGIRLQEDKSGIRYLDEIFRDLMDRLNNAGLDQMKSDYRQIARMSEEELLRLPPQVRKFLMDNYDHLPKELQENLKSLIS